MLRTTKKRPKRYRVTVKTVQRRPRKTTKKRVTRKQRR